MRLLIPLSIVSVLVVALFGCRSVDQARPAGIYSAPTNTPYASVVTIGTNGTVIYPTNFWPVAGSLHTAQIASNAAAAEAAQSSADAANATGALHTAQIASNVDAIVAAQSAANAGCVTGALALAAANAANTTGGLNTAAAAAAQATANAACTTGGMALVAANAANVTGGLNTAQIFRDEINTTLTNWRLIQHAASPYLLQMQGLVDGFVDESGVDTTNSSGQVWVNSSYTPVPALVGLGAGELAHWTCNDTDGVAVADNVGSLAASGTYTPASGVINGALSFDGYSQRVSADLTAFSSLVSMSFWLNFGGGSSAILFNGPDEWNTSLCSWCVASWGQLGIYIDGAANPGGLWWGGNPSGWHHYMVVLNDGNGNGVVYQDNITIHTTSANVTGTLSPLFVGGCGGNYVSAMLDDVRFYNHAVSSLERTSLYNLGLGTEDDSTNTSPTASMHLISQKQYAVQPATNVTVVVMESDGGGVGLNTDLVVSVTADTTHFTPVSLSFTGYYSGTNRILAGSANLPYPGTNMQWLVQTTNQVTPTIYGVGLLWR